MKYVLTKLFIIFKQELGLDLDTMDFGQLDCDFDVKMETHQELMDISDIQMDMDDPDWLDSLLPTSPTTSINATNISSAIAVPSTSTRSVTSRTTITQISTTTIMSSTSSDITSEKNGDKNIDLYDPLLSNSQDPFDLLNIEDTDFKMSSDLPLGWDNGQVDFAS